MSRLRAFALAAVLVIAASGPLASYLLATRQASREALALDRFRQTQVSVALHREHRRDVADCVSRNHIRTNIVAYLDLLVQGAANQGEATVASTTATPDEKNQARKTLDELPAFRAQAHRSFAAEPCPKP